MAKYSNSRKVNGYVRAALKQNKLRARLRAKLAELKPLEEQSKLADAETQKRRLTLTGSQLGEADRILKGLIGSEHEGSLLSWGDKQ